MTSMSNEQAIERIVAIQMAEKTAEYIGPQREEFVIDYGEASDQVAESFDNRVSPTTILLAENDPRAMQRYRSYQTLAEIEKLELMDTERQFADEYDERAEATTKHILRRALATGALVGVSLGAAYTIGLGGAKYDIRDTRGWLPSNVEGQLLPGNTLTADEIALGDGSIRIINPLSFSYGNLVSNTSTESVETTVTASTTPAMAGNPYADNLKLTGEELAIDKAIARDFLQDIKDDNGTVTSIRVEGIASDDYNGALGVNDPEQVTLAQERANTGVEALKQVAGELGIELPDEISTSATEAVVSPEQAELIKKQAELYGESLQKVLDAYNNGETLDPALTQSLDAAISRGVDYSVTYKTETTTTNYKLDNSESADTVPPLGVFGGVGAVSGFMGAVVSVLVTGSRTGKKIQKSAKKDLKNARKES